MESATFSSLKRILFPLIATSCLTVAILTPLSQASDHADGTKVREESNQSGDIASFYAFREGDQTGVPTDNSNLTLVMTLNGKSPSGQKRFFSDKIAYEFHIVPGKSNFKIPKTLTFRFRPEEEDGSQEIFLNDQLAGKTTINHDTPLINRLELNGHKIQIFAGLRDDPFFMDERVLQEGIGTGKTNPQDTYAGTNALAIVASVPIAFLQTDAKEAVFSTWVTTKK